MSPESKPGVCLLTETYVPVVGGGETQARALAEGLIRQGFETMVVTRRSDPAFPRYEEVGPVAVFRIAPSGSAHLKKWGLVLTSVPVLWRYRRRYDMIFVSGFRVLGMVAVLMCKLLGKRCVLKADSLGEMSGEFFEAGLARLRLRPSSVPFRLFIGVRNSILRRAEAFVAISQEIARELVENGVSARKIRLIPNSVSVDRFYPVHDQTKTSLRERLGLPLRSRIVIYTGRLVSYKGLPLLLRVWRDIQERHAGVHLLLVGSGGLDIHNCESELRQYVLDHRLADTVCFTGSVPDVAEYLQASDIFAFPTENEAFGISLVEAMACGLAVVGTSVGGVNDFVDDGRNGLLAPPRDAARLQEALEVLLDDAVLRQRLGIAARRTVEEHYTTRRVLDQYIELFCTS